MYETENEMMIRLSDYFGKRLIFKEIGSGYGIADLIIIKNKAAFNQFVEGRKGVFLSNSDQIKIFKFLRKKKRGVSFDELVQNHYISETRLKYQVLNYLISTGAIIKKNNLYFRNEQFSLFSPRTVAIEGKLNNWKAGLTQAIRYQRFAEQVYVALDEDFVHRADLEEFKKFNIGLISVGPKVKEILAAKISPPLDPIMKYGIAEQLVEKNLKLNARRLREIHF
ncbi:hypothetical protein MMB68_24600 [Priestia sp. Y58]|uniref:hypothetical protein n=1 Tax=Priestia sp. Y58 TaxID=2922804 RepID=UPI002405E247|nr:hypothetical protein [Priestia sp. Y58]MDG0032733.1 hypothetical protein [Priestia sp. Y58]